MIDSGFLSIFNSLISDFSEISDFKTLADKVEELLESTVDPKYTGIYLYDHSEKKLKLWVARNFSEEEKEEAERTAMERHPGYVFKTGKIIHIPDTDKYKGKINLYSKRSFSIQSRLYIPVLNNKEKLGAIGIVCDKKNRFTKADIQILQLICNFTGTIYRNILNIENIKNAKQEVINQSKFPNENPNPIIRVGMDDVVLYANQASSTFFTENKIKKAEKLPQSLKLFTLEAKETNKIVKCKIQDSGKTVTLNIVPFLDAQYINIYCVDITDQVIAEIESVESRNFLNKIINAISDPVFVKDENYRFVLLNESLCKLMNLKQEEILGKTDDDFFPKEQVEVFRKKDKLVLRTGNVDVNEETITTGDGEQMSISTIKSLYINEKGEKFIVGTIRDISEHKLSESLIKESEERYRGLSEATFESIFISEKGVCIEQNAIAEKMFGYSQEEAIGKMGSHWIAQKDHKKVMERMMSGSEEAYLASAQRKNGSTFPAEIQAKMAHYKGRDVRITALRDISERVKIDNKLKSERNLFNLILESISDPIFYKTNSHIYLRCNSAFANLVGKKTEEVIGKTDRNLYSKKETDKHIQSDLEVIRTKKPLVMEEWFEHEGGEREFLSTLKLPAFDNSGNVQGIVGICRNLTYVKEAESLQKQLNDDLQKAVNTLKANESYLKSINNFASAILKRNSIDEIVWEVTRIVIKEMGFVDCIIYLLDDDKKNLIQRAAYGPKHDRGKNIKNPIVIPVGKGIVGTVAKTGVTEVIPDTTKDKRYILDDQQRLSELTVPIIADGEIIGVIDSEHPEKNFYSIEHIEKIQTVSGLISTRMKNAINQEKLLEAQKTLTKLSTAVNISSVSVCITDQRGNIEFVNEAFENLTGYTIEDCKGKKINILKSNTQAIEFYRRLWRTVTRGEKWTGEMINKKKSGEHYWGLSSVSPIVNSEGTCTNYVYMHTDISKLKKLESELIKSKEKAEEADHAKSMFLATMSHEIRTPLNAINGMIRLFEATHLNKEQDELTRGLKYSSDNLMRIVNDILDFEKIELGQLQLESTSFNFIEFIQQIVEPLEYKSEEKNIDLNYEIDDRICKHLIGDPLRLQQILINLLNNAIKFTEKGSVNLFCRFIKQSKKDCWIEFVVRDTGIGIGKNNLDKIFERFIQEDESTTRQYGGTGLGLAISRQLVRLMGGELKAESEKDVGSRFSFTIRLSEADKSSIPKQKSTQIDKTLLKGKKILLVEDNTFNQYIAKSIIEKWNVTVDVVDNGKMAVDYLQKKKVDLILMDKQMPIMDGITATLFIRNKLQLKMPIIALTANVVKGVVQSCLNAGMNDYISKPFEPEKLFDKIVSNLNLNSTVSNKDTLLNPEQPKAQNLYDLSKLTYMLNGDVKQINLMVEKFLKYTPDSIIEIKKALAEDDFEELTSILHKVKSSVSLVANSAINTLLNSVYDSLSSTKNKSHFKTQITDLVQTIELLLEQLKNKEDQ